MANTISNTDDVIDSRDVIARIEELEGERDSYWENPEDGRTAMDWGMENPDDAEELAQLQAFRDEGSSSWDDGETLIRESYFEEHARELADELGLLKDANSLLRSPLRQTWPLTCINWEHAVRELQYDYTGADFDGVTYYFRA